jgi:predicted DCC family thiol-disulfide oxidoreductase YuxK
MNNLMHKYILFFDDACILCNKSIRFIHSLDKHKQIFFCPLQSDLGIEIQQKKQLKQLVSTVIYFRKSKLHVQSSAIFYCLSDIHWALKPVLLLLFIPPFIRNGIYNFIAKNRKKIFKNQLCEIPSESLRKQIVD